MNTQPLLESRPRVRLGFLVIVPIFLALLLVLATCAGQARRTSEAQKSALSGRADWLTDGDMAHMEDSCGGRFVMYELAPGVVKFVCQDGGGQ